MPPREARAPLEQHADRREPGVMAGPPDGLCHVVAEVAGHGARGARFAGSDSSWLVSLAPLTGEEVAVEVLRFRERLLVAAPAAPSGSA